MIIHALRLLAGTFALATSVFVAEASGAELKVLSAGRDARGLARASGEILTLDTRCRGRRSTLCGHSACRIKSSRLLNIIFSNLHYKGMTS